jgi:hypothetical protein
LLQLALGKLNSAAQPYQTYTLTTFPVTQWGALLERALYIEVLRHLIRSYTEMPSPNGVNVARMDRSAYANAYRDLLKDEYDDFQAQFDVFKIAHMGLGRPSILVSGGVFGSYARTRLPISAAARGHMWSRAY